MSEELKKIPSDQVENPYHIWAKKGDIWNNTAHLIKSGSSTTLCGAPLLGNNYKREVKEIGCPVCLAKHKEETENNPVTPKATIL